MSPGPGYGDSRRTPSRTTPNSTVFRPVPQHLSSPGPRNIPYSPVTVNSLGRQGFKHGTSPGPKSPMGR